MTAPTPPSPDSLAAVVAELRRRTAIDHGVTDKLADRIERLDAEMRNVLEQVRSYNDTLTQRCIEDTAELGELRAKLAACEEVVAAWRKSDVDDDYMELIEDFCGAVEAALASRAAAEGKVGS